MQHVRQDGFFSFLLRQGITRDRIIHQLGPLTWFYDVGDGSPLSLRSAEEIELAALQLLLQRYDPEIPAVRVLSMKPWSTWKSAKRLKTFFKQEGLDLMLEPYYWDAELQGLADSPEAENAITHNVILGLQSALAPYHGLHLEAGKDEEDLCEVILADCEHFIQLVGCALFGDEIRAALLRELAVLTERTLLSPPDSLSSKEWVVLVA